MCTRMQCQCCRCRASCRTLTVQPEPGVHRPTAHGSSRQRKLWCHTTARHRALIHIEIDTGDEYDCCARQHKKQPFVLTWRSASSSVVEISTTLPPYFFAIAIAVAVNRRRRPDRPLPSAFGFNAVHRAAGTHAHQHWGARDKSRTGWERRTSGEKL
jgi:hypothetical protein